MVQRRTTRFRAFAGLCLVMLFGVTPGIAGTTGKISGKITDAQTKEALVGVNVLVAGTALGAASDLEGSYFIINLPPGTYQLKASAVGYAPTVVNDVKVFVDQTTRIDFTLQQQAIEIQGVEVTATRPLVQRDLTSTTSTVTTDQISKLPLENVQAAVNLQAGVVEGHFRGGRSNEVKYLVDGVAVNDVFSGSSTLEAEVSSIQEIQVLSGTFNAEYGEALSGVVNQVTKIGGMPTAETSPRMSAIMSALTPTFSIISVLFPPSGGARSTGKRSGSTTSMGHSAVRSSRKATS